ncbi:RNA-binding protein [Mycolicibacterium wolinskyi]|uniref:RNA-binding protein n=1 Tax=Mycolicibacterium wolinskyi TaxID=59750 RepID=UPI000A884ECA|nr:RNA-binding protein [Mycolicibacterium wolinskyi]
MRKLWPAAAATLMFVAGLVVTGPPTAQATICGSIGGRHVDVTGCSDPMSELNDALAPPPPPGYVPPPPPPPNISVCANVGRRINISGCV